MVWKLLCPGLQSLAESHQSSVVAKYCTRSALPSLQDIYIERCSTRAMKTIKDSSLPNNPICSICWRYGFGLLTEVRHVLTEQWGKNIIKWFCSCENNWETQMELFLLTALSGHASYLITVKNLITYFTPLFLFWYYCIYYIISLIPSHYYYCFHYIDHICTHIQIFCALYGY